MLKLWETSVKARKNMCELEYIFFEKFSLQVSGYICVPNRQSLHYSLSSLLLTVKLLVKSLIFFFVPSQ